MNSGKVKNFMKLFEGLRLRGGLEAKVLSKIGPNSVTT